MRRTYAVRLCLFAVPLTILTISSAALAQTTVFTYQGKLADANNPSGNGNYDMQFKLFDTPGVGTGTQQGSPITNPTVAVSTGIFTVTLDFGSNVFTGAARYLEIGVRPAGNPNPYTVLSPRQPITSTPYAIQTVNATQLGGLPASRFVQFDVNNNVGIGTPAPTAKLTLSGFGAYNTQGAARFDLFNTIAGSGFLQHVTDQGLWQIATTTGLSRMVIDPLGNVGIGSVSPSHRLRISGGPTWTSSAWTGAIELDNASAIGWRANAGNQRFGIGQSSGGLYFFRTASDPGATTCATPPCPANYDFVINDSGNVGIGTIAPSSKVEIAAQDGLKISGFQPFLTLRDTNGGNKSSFMQGVNGDAVLLTNSRAALILKDGTGNLGLGTSAPNGKLDARGGSGIGVYAESAAASVDIPGVYGRSTANSGTGVLGAADGTNARGVYGASGNTTGVGVFGQNPVGYAMYANGNVGQARDKGGWVKAMLYVFDDGNIGRCFNSLLSGSAASTPPCGINVSHIGLGEYQIDFGVNFRVDDRFFSALPVFKAFLATSFIGINLDSDPFGDVVRVATFYTNTFTQTNATFHLIVY